MIDFNKKIEEQINNYKQLSLKTKNKSLSLTELKLKYKNDLDNLKEESLIDRIEELYNKIFIDTTLVKILFNQIKNVTCEEDKYKPFDLSIDFFVSRKERWILDSWVCEYKKTSSINGMHVNIPNIGNTLDIEGNDFSNNDLELIRIILPKYIVLNNLPYFIKWDIKENTVVHNWEDIKYFNLCFTTTLENLLNMYYMEKQKQEGQDLNATKHTK